MADFIKACVSFSIRDIETPLFKAKVEQVVAPQLDQLDAQTMENLIFFLKGGQSGRGEIRNGNLVQKILHQIE